MKLINFFFNLSNERISYFIIFVYCLYFSLVKMHF